MLRRCTGEFVQGCMAVAWLVYSRRKALGLLRERQMELFRRY